MIICCREIRHRAFRYPDSPSLKGDWLWDGSFSPLLPGYSCRFCASLWFCLFTSSILRLFSYVICTIYQPLATHCCRLCSQPVQDFSDPPHSIPMLAHPLMQPDPTCRVWCVRRYFLSLCQFTHMSPHYRHPNQGTQFHLEIRQLSCWTDRSGLSFHETYYPLWVA